jgi:hypothetical protein
MKKTALQLAVAAIVSNFKFGLANGSREIIQQG